MSNNARVDGTVSGRAGMAPAALDTLYTVESPEGIALTLRPAGLVSRGLAYAIDMMIRIGVYAVAALLVSPFKGMGQAFIIILVFALEWFYPVVFELSRHAATPGKRALGLRVVMDSGLPVTPAASLTRNLLRAADFLPFLYTFGVLTLLWREDFKRLGDLAAGTLVVHDRQVLLHAPWPQVAPASPARPLSLREQAAVVAWAGRHERLTPDRMEELARLAQGVLPPQGPGDTTGAPTAVTPRLLAVVQWAMGRRPAGSRS